MCLTLVETQPEKSLSSPCVASEADTENLRSTISQGSGYVVLLFAPSWPEQAEQKTWHSNNFPVKRNKAYVTYFMYLDTLMVTQLQFLYFQFLLYIHRFV